MNQAAQKQKLDMLNGSLWNKIPQFALPVAATAILEQLFNASDIAVVGNFSGTASTIAVAAVGANSFVISLVVNFFIGIALGANVVIANAIGREDEDAVHRAVHTAVVISVLGGVLVTLFGELAAGTVLRSLNVPEKVLPYALLYLRIYLLGVPVILLYNFEAAIFRSVGDTKVPLQTLAFSGVLNVLLNLFFVIVLHMTVNGVATATVISNAISSSLLFVRLRRSDKAIQLNWKELRIDRKSLQKILQIGFPAGIQSAVFSISNIVIQSAINSLGTVVMAASSAAFNIEVIAYDVLSSFSQACTTFVGQNYGARKLDRCRKTLVLCLVEDTVASGLAIMLVLCSGHFLLSLFNQDPEVISIGYTRLMVVFTAYFFSMLYEVMSGYLRGFGISLVPALLTMLGVCGVRILWVATAFPQHRSFQTILLAYPLSLAATAVLIFIALLVYHPSHKTKGEAV